ncbi:hypothetical protein P7C70_g8420, partial [Phenoliferia sp. Uapishka_3]
MINIDFPAGLDPMDEEELTAVSLSHCSTALSLASRIVVCTGAGISTSCGIPDFRGSNGIYTSNSSSPPISQSSQSSSEASSSSSPTPRKRPKMTAQQGRNLFDASVYLSASTRAKHLRFLADLAKQAEEAAESATHKFMRELKGAGSLLRVFTQNIDGLEGRGNGVDGDEEVGGLSYVELPGIASQRSTVRGKKRRREEEDEIDEEEEFPGEVVQLHGNLQSVRCSSCAWTGEWEEVHGEAFARGETVECPNCLKRVEERRAQSKRTTALRTFVRPAVTLYNEPCSAADRIGEVINADLASSPDLLLVFGTSLRIPGFKSLVKEFAQTVQENGGLRILVNIGDVSAEWDDVFDYRFVTPCDEFSNRVLADWKDACPQHFGLPDTFKRTKRHYVETPSDNEDSSGSESESDFDSDSESETEPTPPPSKSPRKSSIPAPSSGQTSEEVEMEVVPETEPESEGKDEEVDELASDAEVDQLESDVEPVATQGALESEMQVIEDSEPERESNRSSVLERERDSQVVELTWEERYPRRARNRARREKLARKLEKRAARALKAEQQRMVAEQEESEREESVVAETETEEEAVRRMKAERREARRERNLAKRECKEMKAKRRADRARRKEERKKQREEEEAEREREKEKEKEKVEKVKLTPEEMLARKMRNLAKREKMEKKLKKRAERALLDRNDIC